MENIFENITNLLKAHYQFVIIAFGLLIIVGCIFDWDWIVTPTGKLQNSILGSFVINNWGRNGMRVLHAIFGIIIIICGITMYIYRSAY